jgi:hypothetical protein
MGTRGVSVHEMWIFFARGPPYLSLGCQAYQVSSRDRRCGGDEEIVVGFRAPDISFFSPVDTSSAPIRYQKIPSHAVVGSCTMLLSRGLGLAAAVPFVLGISVMPMLPGNIAILLQNGICHPTHLDSLLYIHFTRIHRPLYLHFIPTTLRRDPHVSLTPPYHPTTYPPAPTSLVPPCLSPASGETTSRRWPASPALGVETGAAARGARGRHGAGVRRPVLCWGGRQRGAHEGELGEEAQQPAGRAPRHAADEADAREVELHDRGVGRIAPDAGPGAGRHGRIPAQHALVQRVSAPRLGGGQAGGAPAGWGSSGSAVVDGEPAQGRRGGCVRLELGEEAISGDLEIDLPLRVHGRRHPSHPWPPLLLLRRQAPLGVARASSQSDILPPLLVRRGGGAASPLQRPGGWYGAGADDIRGHHLG